MARDARPIGYIMAEYELHQELIGVPNSAGSGASDQARRAFPCGQNTRTARNSVA
jgi:hypothetical protein